MTKERVTISIDAELAAAGASAVREGRADSVSAWISEALVDRVMRERKLAAMAEAVKAYEAEHGVITAEEMRDQARADRDAAATLRASTPRKPRRR